MSPLLDHEPLQQFINKHFYESALPVLENVIRIPNQSANFEKDFEKLNDLHEQVAKVLLQWVDSQQPHIPGLVYEIHRIPGKSPLIFIEVPGSVDTTVMLYGHADKQPPMLPWSDGLDPYVPVIRDGKLYGRGGADDAYSIFSSLLAIRYLKEHNIPCPRCVLTMEFSEESGSIDLAEHLAYYKDRIGTPAVMVCLDSGCVDYDTFYLTSSLRGIVTGTLTVTTLTAGVHSGDASGIVPDSFRIIRQILSRIEDEKTGEVLVPELHCKIPAERIEDAKLLAAQVGMDGIAGKYPWHGSSHAIPCSSPADLLLNQGWRPTLSIVGADGLPPTAKAGNVCRPSTSLKLSIRLPPHVDCELAGEALKRELLRDPPYGATLTWEGGHGASGWDAPATAPWLKEAVAHASQQSFGKAPLVLFQGGTIPLMGTIQKQFPGVQFLVTGVLGPASNAHGPDEFLELNYCCKLTAAVTHIIARIPHQKL